MVSKIVKGKASLTMRGLRCQNTRPNREGWLCHKLIAVYNKKQQIAGNFKCERCAQSIEVEYN